MCERQLLLEEDLFEIEQLIIRSNQLDQFSTYNILCDPKPELLRIYHSLHLKYLSSPNKKNLLIKEVREFSTDFLFASIDWVLIGSIKNGAGAKGVEEVIRGVVEDLQIDEEGIFIMRGS